MSDVHERKMEKNLELLYDYTKFHIGTYTTLATLYIGIANAKFSGFCVLLNRPFYTVAVLALLVAGLAGGTVVSSITQSKALDSETFPGRPRGWFFRPLYGLASNISRSGLLWPQPFSR